MLEERLIKTLNPLWKNLSKIRNDNFIEDVLLLIISCIEEEDLYKSLDISLSDYLNIFDSESKDFFIKLIIRDLKKEIYEL